MALVRTSTAHTSNDKASNGLGHEGKSVTTSSRDVEAQRKRARTLAKQQQAAERIAAATGQLSCGINEAT
jgi:methyl-accepting chemotaxis protein